jgi:hypothetical protein
MTTDHRASAVYVGTLTNTCVEGRGFMSPLIDHRASAVYAGIVDPHVRGRKIVYESLDLWQGFAQLPYGDISTKSAMLQEVR